MYEDAYSGFSVHATSFAMATSREDSHDDIYCSDVKINFVRRHNWQVLSKILFVIAHSRLEF